MVAIRNQAWMVNELGKPHLFELGGRDLENTAAAGLTNEVPIAAWRVSCKTASGVASWLSGAYRFGQHIEQVMNGSRELRVQTFVARKNNHR